MSTVIPTVLSTVLPTVTASLSPGGVTPPRFTFNGVDQYATFAGWTPLGLPFDVEINATPLTVDGTEQVITRNGTATPLHRIAANNVYQYRRQDADGATLSLTGGTAVVGEGVKHNYSAVGGQDDYSAASASVGAGADLTAVGVSSIAASSNGAFPFHGPVWQLKLTDNSPIQDTFANMGNGTRYGVLDEAITLLGTEDWDISGEAIRQDRTGTSSTNYVGVIDAGSAIVAHDTGSASPDRMNLNRSGAISSFNDALANIAIGQHYKWEIQYRTGVGATLLIDGVISSGPFGGGNLSNFVLDQIYSSNGSIMPTDAALKNLYIKDITNSLEWFYSLVPADIDAEIGNAAFVASTTTIVPTTFGLAGPTITSWTIASDDKCTLVLDGAVTTPPVTLVMGKFTFPFTESPTNTWIGYVPGIYDRALAENIRIEFTEKGLIFTSLDIVNTDPSTQGNYNNLPIYDTVVNEGDGALYGTIPEFTVSAGDAEFSWESIRQDRTGTTNTAILGRVGDGTSNYLLTYDTANGSTPDAIKLQWVGGSATFADALADIALGQHYSGRLVKTGTSAELFIDDVSVDTLVVSSSIELTFDAIGTFGTAGFQATGSALQNVILHNLTTGEYVKYKLDEVSGLGFKAYDINDVEIGLGAELWTDPPDTVTSPWIDLGAGEYSIDGSQAANTDLTVTTPVEVKWYMVQYDVSGYSTGSVSLRAGGANGVPVSADGTHQEIFQSSATGANFRIRADASFIGTVANISIRETKDGEWTAENKVVIPPYSTNGQWTPDTDWRFIPDNSRYYPMNDGSPGGVFKAYDGNGNPIPADDATIINPGSAGGGWSDGPKPLPPVNGAATGFFDPPGRVELTWDDNPSSPSPAVSYNIIRAGQPTVSIPAPTTNYSDTRDLDADMAYSYTIQAVTAAGSGKQTAPINVAIPTLVLAAAPPNVAVVEQTQTEVRITWDAATAGSYPLDHYRIYRNGVAVGDTVGLLLTFDDAPNYGTDLRYTVAAVDTEGFVGILSVADAASTLEIWAGLPALMRYDETSIVGDPVTAWTNLGTNGSDSDLTVGGTPAGLTQSTLNGLPSILNDGTAVMSSAVSLVVPHPISVISVFRYGEIGANNKSMLESRGNSGIRLALYTRPLAGDNGDFGLYAGGPINVEPLDTEWHVFTAAVAADNIAEYRITGLGTVTGNIGSQSWETLRYMGPLSTVNDIVTEGAELLIFDYELSATQMNFWEAHLKAKWAI